MRDKEKIDADFLDSAWADMHSRLDEHMPVQKRRRRGFVYWRWGMAAALLLLLSLPTCWYLQEHNGDIDVGFASDSTPTAPSNKITKADQNQQQASVNDTPIESAENAIAEPENNLTPTPSNSSISNEISLTPNAKSNTQTLPLNNNLQNPEKVVADPKEEIVIANNEPTPNSSQEEATGFNPLRTLRTIYEPQSIPSLEAKLLAIEEPSTPDLKIDQPRIAAAMYVEADGFINPSSTVISGFGLGIGRQAPLVGKLKWNVGLAYRFNRWYLNAAQDQARVQTVVDAELGLSEDVLVVGGNTVSILTSVVKEHVIEVPLSLSLQTGDRWQFDAGIAASYALGSYAGDIRATADAANGFSPEAQSVFNDLAASSSRWYGGSSGTRIVEDRLNPLRFDADININYRLSGRWGLQVQGRYNISPPVKREFVELSNTTIGMGLRYYFQ